jgi:hypothetical protein
MESRFVHAAQDPSRTRRKAPASAAMAGAAPARGAYGVGRQSEEKLPMTRRSRIWLTLAVLFTAANFAGGLFAAAQGELIHAGVHAALMLLGLYPVWRLTSGGRERRTQRGDDEAIQASPRELTDRLTRLEQAVDAAAIEVERVGEWQRFLTHSFTEDGAPQAGRDGVAEPTPVEEREPARRDRRE